MTNNDRLEFCVVCVKRKMDLRRGLLCSLTDKKADFEETCQQFVKDNDEANFLLKQKMAATGDEDVGDPFDFDKNKKNGALLFWIGVFITFTSHAISAHFGFYFISYGTIVYGITQYYKGVEQEKTFNMHKKDE